MTAQSVYEELYREYGLKNKRVGQICLILGVVILIGSVVMGVNKLGIIVAIGILVVSLFGFSYSRSFMKNYAPENISIENHVVIKKENHLATTGSHSILYFDSDYNYEFPVTKKVLYDKADVGDKYDLAIIKGSNRALKIELTEKVDPRFVNPTIIMMKGDESDTAAVVTAATTAEAATDAVSMFKSVMDQEEDEVILCNLFHKVLYANTAAKETYGIDVEGKTAFDIWDSKEVSEIQKKLLDFSESKGNDRILLSEDENQKNYLGAIRDSGKELGAYYWKTVKK